jgi:ribosome-binding protein aMBF1 (putative translation factor)
MSTQDWNTVVITKQKTKKDLIKSGAKTLEKKYDGGKNKQTSGAVQDLRTIEDDVITTLPHSDRSLSLQIQQARLAKQVGGHTMTQSDLNKACNLPANTVRDYENGTAIVKQHELTAMSRALGVMLKKPKVAKSKDIE